MVKDKKIHPPKMKEVKDRVKIYERTLIFIRLGLT